MFLATWITYTGFLTSFSEKYNTRGFLLRFQKNIPYFGGPGPGSNTRGFLLRFQKKYSENEYFKLLKKYRKYIVQKGSITINGVSLTIAKILKDGFQISIIPHTLRFTNLIYLKEKDIVNIEFDVLGKYIKNFIK